MSALAIHPVAQVPVAQVPVAPHRGRKSAQGQAGRGRHLSVVNSDYLAEREAERGAGKTSRNARNSAVLTSRSQRPAHGVGTSYVPVLNSAARRPRAVEAGPAIGAVRAAYFVGVSHPSEGADRAKPQATAVSVSSAQATPAAVGGGFAQWIRETAEMLLVAGAAFLAAGMIAVTMLGMIRP